MQCGTQVMAKRCHDLLPAENWGVSIVSYRKDCD